MNTAVRVEARSRGRFLNCIGASNLPQAPCPPVFSQQAMLQRPNSRQRPGHTSTQPIAAGAATSAAPSPRRPPAASMHRAVAAASWRPAIGAGGLAARRHLQPFALWSRAAALGGRQQLSDAPSSGPVGGGGRPAPTTLLTHAAPGGGRRAAASLITPRAAAPRRDFLEARQVSLFELFTGTAFKFDIPDYQRPYSWRPKQVGGRVGSRHHHSSSLPCFAEQPADAVPSLSAPIAQPFFDEQRLWGRPARRQPPANQPTTTNQPPTTRPPGLRAPHRPPVRLCPGAGVLPRRDRDDAPGGRRERALPGAQLIA